MRRAATRSHQVLHVDAGASRRRRDVLAVEEPLEIRVGGETVSVTMRTPGHDFELALGYCLADGVVTDAGDVERITYCTPSPGPYQGDYNVVDLERRGGSAAVAVEPRRAYTTSSCGLCGSASIAAVRRAAPDVTGDHVRVAPATLAGMPDRLRAGQRAFERTGGLHAAGLFDADGGLVCLREDVGRHNAVDKVIGWAATERRLPLAGHVLLVSGRVAFEIAQKALVAGIPVVAAVSAPSSLAVDLAEEAGMTLVGFLRGATMNVYAGAGRLTLPGRAPRGAAPASPDA